MKADSNKPLTLPQKVAQWLGTQGYPFELSVGRQLRECGFVSVNHGQYFRDTRTGKWREVDIVAFHHRANMDGAGVGNTVAVPPYVYIRFVVECKQGTKPWVVLESDRSMSTRVFPASLLVGYTAMAMVEQAGMPNVTANSQHGTGVTLRAFSFGPRCVFRRS